MLPSSVLLLALTLPGPAPLTAAEPHLHARAIRQATSAVEVDPDGANHPGFRVEDASSPDAIVAALYDVISGPAGRPRDWDRFRALFLPGSARLVGMGMNSAGQVAYRPMTPEEYLSSSGPVLERDGFFEVEIGFREERFGNVVHRFSAYAARRTPEDPTPFMRGINSIQLLFDGTRWWVVTVLWDQERPGNPIPAALGG